LTVHKGRMQQMFSFDQHLTHYGYDARETPDAC
jgi:hypothetical protein